MSGRFIDVSFPRQYPQHDVADNEVLLSFRNDEDGIRFREWWHEQGSGLFGKWLRSRPPPP